MKRISLLFYAALVLSGSARGDLTIVQKVEGAGANLDQMVIKMKGEKTRIETGPSTSTIIDGKTGDTTTLLHSQKQVMRIPGERVKAMVEMANKFKATGTAPGQSSKLNATGKTEKIAGMDTQIYTAEGPQWKATYWIAISYPNASEILKQMQAMQPAQWGGQNSGIPDYRNFPGVPIKTVIDLGGKQITSTLVSIKQDPIADADFAIPPGYTEMKLPAIIGGKNTPAEGQGASQMPTLPQTAPSVSPTP
ncbi:MAG TPA: DUF4412 domain-containing protein [Chthoniobacterales bacterium]|jgi:hypothetical protein